LFSFDRSFFRSPSGFVQAHGLAESVTAPPIQTVATVRVFIMN
jgi:hypothetical protein